MRGSILEVVTGAFSFGCCRQTPLWVFVCLMGLPLGHSRYWHLILQCHGRTGGEGAHMGEDVTAVPTGGWGLRA
ncbi:hypothetical protein [Corynebacterium efficiens YS-314]|uniref:Uncharacterized protein n=1 Tax=Corynebacterium efficiens (strain DSM 44549 / YS-314 / AJ 12310 / JCM 11189 / NBRC 100395) TaxID=196164 RepID=Q8FP73_COREF|nr:hypothetical protein [Corynebacterium efficiens YS-314]